MRLRETQRSPQLRADLPFGANTKRFALLRGQQLFEEYALDWLYLENDLTLASSYRPSVFVAGRRLHRRAESGNGIRGIQTRRRRVRYGGALSVVWRGKNAGRAAEALPGILGDAAP